MVKIPLKSSSFSLDSSGVAGFFGGDEAVSAMGAVHLYAGRRWLGWYNAPGSYEIAKKYGQLARARFWDGLFPGPNVEPEVLFELDGQKGPAYKGLHSGTKMPQTGHIGYLFMKECEELKAETVEGRTTTPYGFTIAKLDHVPGPNMITNPLSTHAAVVSAIPIAASAAACALCAVFGDWYSFSMILLGILCSGISCFVIGSGNLRFEHPEPAKGSPRGDGILTEGTEVVMLLGEEGAVNSITRGKFTLRFEKWFHRLKKGKEQEREYRSVGLCSLLLIGQFLAQLLLIPQGELFGQIMFLASLGVSWGYNLYLSSLDKEVIQRRILMNKVLVPPPMKKYALGTRTTMAVFLALLVDSNGRSQTSAGNPPAIHRKQRIVQVLLDIIPNNTPAWAAWRATVAEKIVTSQPLAFNSTHWEGAGGDAIMLRDLYGDAESAHKAFLQYQQQSPPSPLERRVQSSPTPTLVMVPQIGSSTPQEKGYDNV